MRRLAALTLCVLGLLWSEAKLVDKFTAGHSSLGLAATDPRLAELITFGHKRVFNDLLHLWLLQKLIPSPGGQGISADKLRQKVRAVARHRPKILSFYLLGCFTLTYAYGDPNFCVEILTLGFAVMPQQWILPATAGYMAAFKLAQPKRAAHYYRQASQIATAPPYLTSLARSLEKGELPKRRGGDHELELLFRGVKDWRLRRHLKGYPRKH